TGDAWAPLVAAFAYDGYGHLAQVNQGLGSLWLVNSVAAQGLASAVVGAAWASLTDGNSHTTNFLLDNRARLLQQVQPDGATDSYVRDAAGQVVAAIDPLWRVTQYSYAYGGLWHEKPENGKIAKTGSYLSSPDYRFPEFRAKAPTGPTTAR